MFLKPQGNPVSLGMDVMNDSTYALLVGVQRFSLLYATLYIPLAFKADTYLWVSLGYAALAVGGLMGYLLGFRRWFSIPTIVLAVLVLLYKPLLIPLLGFLGMLHSIIVPNAYVMFGNSGVAKSYTASSIAYLLSGLAIYFTKEPVPLLATLLLIFLPAIRRSVRESIGYMYSFMVNLDFLWVIPYTVSTFIVGGLYTVYLSTMPNFDGYEKVILALSAGLMGVLRWISDRFVDEVLWISVALTGVMFILYSFYPGVVTALLFIVPYSLVYPLVTMSAGKGSRDPMTSINAAFAGTSTGESIMPTLFHYNRYLVIALSASLIILPLAARYGNRRLGLSRIAVR
jgi:hypothetical protein